VELFDGTQKEPCLFFKPLIELLGAQPDFSDDANSPEEWARLLREHIGDRWDDSKKFGYGATARCFRVHTDLLSTRILVEKVADPANQGRRNLYRLQLKVERRSAGKAYTGCLDCIIPGRLQCLPMRRTPWIPSYGTHPHQIRGAK